VSEEGREKNKRKQRKQEEVTILASITTTEGIVEFSPSF
jgi:hypothetical protein